MPPVSETQQTQQTESPTTETTEQPTTQQTTQEGSESTQGTESTSLLNEPEGTEGKQPEAAGAPDKYEAFKAPDSWAEKGLELDPKSIEQAIPIFKELGLSQEGAQKLIDLYTSVAEANNDAAMQTVTDMRKAWRDEVAADKVVGHRMAEVKKGVNDMFNALGDAKLVSAFKEAMNLTGAGDHPAFIRAMDLWSARFKEGTHVQGNGPSPHGQPTGSKPESAAKALYPNNP